MCHLEESGKDISGLTSDHEQTRVELTEAGVQVLETLQQESGGRQESGVVNILMQILSSRVRTSEDA